MKTLNLFLIVLLCIVGRSLGGPTLVDKAQLVHPKTSNNPVCRSKVCQDYCYPKSDRSCAKRTNFDDEQFEICLPGERAALANIKVSQLGDLSQKSSPEVSRYTIKELCETKACTDYQIRRFSCVQHRFSSLQYVTYVGMTSHYPDGCTSSGSDNNERCHDPQVHTWYCERRTDQYNGRTSAFFCPNTRSEQPLNETLDKPCFRLVTTVQPFSPIELYDWFNLQIQQPYIAPPVYWYQFNNGMNQAYASFLNFDVSETRIYFDDDIKPTWMRVTVLFPGEQTYTLRPTNQDGSEYTGTYANGEPVFGQTEAWSYVNTKSTLKWRWYDETGRLLNKRPYFARSNKSNNIDPVANDRRQMRILFEAKNKNVGEEAVVRPIGSMVFDNLFAKKYWRESYVYVGAN